MNMAYLLVTTGSMATVTTTKMGKYPNEV